MIIETKSGGKIEYIENFLNDDYYSKSLFDYFLDHVPWKESYYNFYGKQIKMPRLTAWYGSKSYSYSGIKNEPLEFTPHLSDLKNIIETRCNLPNMFNSCLLNLYRNGKDSVGFHCDDEKELEENPIIASLSLGATRTFILDQKFDKLNSEVEDRIILNLQHNSLLLMSGTLQHHWKHSIPKEPSIKEPRINLTFRKII